MTRQLDIGIKRKLPPDKLRRAKPPESWKFSTTDDITLDKPRKLEPLIGQQRAVESIEFGLAVDGKGYNIFVVGQPGSGRTSYILERLQSMAASLPAPSHQEQEDFPCPLSPKSCRDSAHILRANPRPISHGSPTEKHSPDPDGQSVSAN